MLIDTPKMSHGHSQSNLVRPMLENPRFVNRIFDQRMIMIGKRQYIFAPSITDYEDFTQLA